MSSETILTASDGGRWSLDNLQVNAANRGEVSGAEQAAAELERLAVELFAASKDAEAVWLRETAKNLRSGLVMRLKNIAERVKREHPDEAPPEDED